MPSTPHRVTEAVIACRNSVSHILAENIPDIDVVKLAAIRGIISFFDNPPGDLPPNFAENLTRLSDWANHKAIAIDTKLATIKGILIALSGTFLYLIIVTFHLFHDIIIPGAIVCGCIITLGALQMREFQVPKIIASHLTTIGTNLVVLETYLNSLTKKD